MMAFLQSALPYLGAFFGAFILTFILTPIVRETHRRIGMVDKPDPRRINKVPIPRGGGLAIVLGVLASYAVFLLVTGRQPVIGTRPGVFLKMAALSVAIALIGLADDRFSLKPKVKLAGQVIVAALTWSWVDIGFSDLWPILPAWLDCLLTVFWIVGAINAFNLIDGLDGLASGLALIAIMGMAGGVFFTASPGGTLFYFSMMGGLVAFLRYNFNPASVFLGDCGSMFLGYVIASLPLLSHVPNSFLISVGVPLLAMGVPIFDTSLAILRRSVRHLLRKREQGEESVGNDKVMQADSDHLHHRLLRAMGANQRRVAWSLYALALAGVLVGLVGLWLRSRAAGLWLIALAGASVVIFRDMAMIELFDTGRLLDLMAHHQSHTSRRRWMRLYVPLLVAFDLAALIAAFLIAAYLMRMPFSLQTLRVPLPLRVASMFACLIGFQTYTTVWGRAMGSNFRRLLIACVLGSLIGAGLMVFSHPVHIPLRDLLSFTFLYGLLAFTLLFGVRMLRGLVRDTFYAIDCARIREGTPGVSRVLVYGAGLRYRAFRRDLVRHTSRNCRLIVGLLDDDYTLRGKYIGGVRIYGTINQAPEVIRETQATEVVIACLIEKEWLEVVRKILAPTGVKVTLFSYTETELQKGQ